MGSADDTRQKWTLGKCGFPALTGALVALLCILCTGASAAQQVATPPTPAPEPTAPASGSPEKTTICHLQQGGDYATVVVASDDPDLGGHAAHSGDIILTEGGSCPYGPSPAASAQAGGSSGASGPAGSTGATGVTVTAGATGSQGSGSTLGSNGDAKHKAKPGPGKPLPGTGLDDRPAALVIAVLALISFTTRRASRRVV